MLTIYGVYRSRASRNYWMALELGLTFRSVPVIQARRLADPLAVDAPLNTTTTSYLAINPVGLIPAIDDDGLVLTESLTNNLYLARKHGGPLAGQSLGEEALMANWTMWVATAVEPQAVAIILAHDAGQQESETGRATIAAAVTALTKSFHLLEVRLASSDWLVGERFTVADLNVAEVLRYTMSQKALFGAHPHVRDWLSRCHARPAFKTMLAARMSEPE